MTAREMPEFDRLREAVNWLSEYASVLAQRDDMLLAPLEDVETAVRLLVEAVEAVCPQCEGDGEVLPHDGETDCDACVSGEWDNHLIDCPTCRGLGLGWFIPRRFA